MKNEIKAIIAGLATYLGYSGLNETGGGGDSRYSYTVWLRHLVMTSKYRNKDFPITVCELGPGRSIGCGICAVLSGAQTYVALDAVPFSSTHLDNRIVEEIYTLLLKNCPIPGDDEFPKVNPRLERYDFPIDILSISRQSLESNKKKLQSSIRYVAPMTNATALPDGSVDYLFSQAVMEHVSDIRDIYSNCYRVLKMGGIMSHSIDFKSHGKSTAWNGHWQYPAWLWRIVVGKRPFLINRQPLSSHLKVIEECGFEVLEVIPVIKKNSILRHRLASEFKNLNVRDLTTAGVFIIASKR